jgi:hypothetical protein
MKHTATLNGIDYEIVIIDDAIVLQSLGQDVVFENGYREICRELANEWWKQGAIGSQRNYILEYENEAIQEYIKNKKGLEVIHNNN